MIVAVESNFVLQIALGQEGAKSALYILALAEAREIELVVPECALTEPFDTLTDE